MLTVRKDIEVSHLQGDAMPSPSVIITSAIYMTDVCDKTYLMWLPSEQKLPLFYCTQFVNKIAFDDPKYL